MEDSDIRNDGATLNAEGCWSCRLRRKKCDRHMPVCHVCSTLLITCHYAPTKPEWLDGGERQREMTEQLKQEVKDKAPHRRSFAYAKAIAEPMPNHLSADQLESDSRELSNADPWTNSSQGILGVNSRSRDENTHATALDRGLLVSYLDFYFPFLFPFYQPSMLDRGRAWVIDFITDSPAMEKATLSLSSHFFSLALDTTEEPAHGTCKQIAWNNLLKQMQDTFEALNNELQSLTSNELPKDLPKAVRIMGCILLLQRFEIATQGYNNCEAHLNAAIELLQPILEGAKVAAGDLATGGLSMFALAMSQLRGYGSTAGTQFPTFNSPSSEQMAFRFFTALLLLDDIVASTALGEAPRLLPYHDGILGDGQWRARADEEPPIRLEGIMGCQNWAIVAIAKTSALVAWKKSQMAAGDLDMTELVLRATPIKSMLATNLSGIEAVHPPLTSTDATRAWDIFTPVNGQASALADQSVLVTRIWAHAAALYLSVAVSGWQPSSSEICHHVTCIVAMLTQRKLSWAALRAVAWPFCIAGCLALPLQEPLLRSVVEGLRPPSLLGPLQKALQIMEAMWRSKNTAEFSSWDIAACFRGQGHLVLLV